MATVPMPFLDKPTIPTREWLRRELTAIARQLELDDVRAVSTTLANTALWDENMDAHRAQFAGILTDRLAAALDDAQAHGEITLALTSRNAAAMTHRSRRRSPGHLVHRLVSCPDRHGPVFTGGRIRRRFR
jgi:hypothetical protein